MSTKAKSQFVKEHNLALAGGKAGTLAPDQLKLNIMEELQTSIKELDSLRAGSKERKAIDLTFGEFTKEKFGFSPADNGSPDSFFNALGIDPSSATLETLYSTPDVNGSLRWLTPEVFREAVRLGMRRGPVYKDLIAASETVSQKSVTMPQINMSDARAERIGEAESIPVGTVSFDDKTVKIGKIATGIEVSDEVIKYVPINIVGLYLQDVGITLGHSLDIELLDVAINGDQEDGSDAAAVIGVETINEFVYRDLLRAWLRMGRLGKLPAGMLSGEEIALDILELPEFKALPGNATLKNIVLKTPIPQSQNYWIHGSMPDTQVMLVDPTSAFIQLTSAALSVETDRIVQKQINGSYASITTGFATLFRDGRLIIDQSLAYATNKFPSWMDISAYERSKSFKK